MSVPAQVEAFVLHRRAWRESSALIEVFSAEHGRVGLVARGLRSRRGWSGLLQPFRPLWLQWRGRGELQTLVGVEPGGPAFELQRRRLYCGLYLNELLLRLLPRHDDHPRLYRRYIEVLQHLASGASEAPALRVFEKRLLGELGFALQLAREVDSDAPVQSDHRYRYDPEAGPRPLARGGVAGASLLALRDERFADREQLREARAVLRVAIDSALGGRELVSRRMLNRQEPS